MNRRNIKKLSVSELASYVSSIGEPRHRTGQILRWLYKKGATTFDEMTNLSLTLRRTLAESFTIPSFNAIESARSTDGGAEKFLLACDDGNLIEAVLMESDGHQTICISSQIGCPLDCSFCRTGSGGYVRNLGSDEILNQILFFKRGHLRPRRRFNIVFMGMGEPFLNTTELVRAIEILNAEDGFALKEKRITVSTIGIPKAILDVARSPLSFGLAISLNATTNGTRRRLMPRAHDLFDTLAAGEAFATARKTRVTLEYVIIRGVNDSNEDAARLAALTAGRPFKINLIPFNEWEGCPFKAPSETRLDQFITLLLPGTPAVTVRRSRGRDICAACGQLRARSRTREDHIDRRS
jgi:23S rRNA (adenine2503-C2)-methyltransferase